MVASVRVKRHVGNAQTPVAADVTLAELAYEDPSVGGTGAGDRLWIGHGGVLAPTLLIGAARQLELQGIQAIAAGAAKTIGIADLKIPGGNAGDVISTDGAGNLIYIPAAAGGGGAVVSDATLSGTGEAADPLSVVVAGAVQRGAVNIPAGSALTLTGSALGMMVASAGDITTGDNLILPITPFGLRGPMGDDVANLVTVEKTVVPAINELKGAVDALASNQRFGGGYNPATNVVTPSAGSPWPAGALVAATTAMTGWYLIITAAFTAPGPLPPTGTYAPGDWLAVDTDPKYLHLQLGLGPVFVDGVSIIGDGLTPASRLEVDVVDGGTY